MIGKLKSLAGMYGISVARFGSAARNTAPYFKNRKRMKAIVAEREAAGTLEFPMGKPYPCLHDRTDSGGHPGGAYFHMDLWAAQRVFRNKPAEHVDVGSAVAGFCAHVAVFMPIRVIDIRPTRSSARNLSFEVCDLMDIPDDYVECTDSLSCLHALEHFGLGRYGDPLDYDGYRKGWDNLLRMLRPGGKFYFAVPVGERQRIEFDAHRVFSVPFIVEEMIGDRLTIDDFAYVDDEGEMHHEIDPRGEDAGRTFGLKWGCGMFELTKNPG